MNQDLEQIQAKPNTQFGADQPNASKFPSKITNIANSSSEQKTQGSNNKGIPNDSYSTPVDSKAQGLTLDDLDVEDE